MMAQNYHLIIDDVAPILMSSPVTSVTHYLPLYLARRNLREKCAAVVSHNDTSFVVAAKPRLHHERRSRCSQDT